jgi:hypothetical protein
MKVRSYIISVLILTLIPVGSLAATAVILPSEDTYVDSNHPSQRYHDSGSLRVMHEWTPPNPEWTARAFLKFDLSSIPPDATINVAYMYLYDRTTSGALNVYVHNLTSDWIDTLTTWNNQPTYSPSVIGSIETYNAAFRHYVDLTSLVTSWHAGSLSNNGVAIVPSDAFCFNCYSRNFDSKEAYLGQWPFLVVIYNAESIEITPTQDTYISFVDSLVNFGSDPSLEIRYAGGWSYLQFSTAGVPAGATIEFARLKMLQYYGSEIMFPSDGFPVSARQVTSSWDELAVTWKTRPTHNATPECVNGNVAKSGAHWLDLEITNLFGSWYFGGIANHGLLVNNPLDGDTTTSGRYGLFRSREHATATEQPRIEVYYTIAPANVFTPSQTLTGLSDSEAAWGDFDGDGDLDLAVCGDNGTTPVTETYENDGGTLTPRANSIPGVLKDLGSSNSLAWGDYDNDGDLDLAIAGYTGTAPLTRIYNNDGKGNLTWDSGQALTQVRYASLGWGDYDNDGDLDLFVQGLMGSSPRCYLYRNDPTGTLTNTGTPFQHVYAGTASWADWDGDGDLDLMSTGSDFSRRYTTFYENDGAGGFTDIGDKGLPWICYCHVAWGDYDRDGDLDLALMGQSQDGQRYARIYNNNGLGDLTVVWNAPSGLLRGGCAWGDYDNDGRLDVAFSGAAATNNYATHIYFNDGTNTFVRQTTPLVPDVYMGSVTWADVDDDADLDFFLTGIDTLGTRYTQLYDNSGGVANTRPTAPDAFSTVRHNAWIPFAPDTLSLSWAGATDAETTREALYYCVRIGTSMDGDDLLSGTYGTPLMGNVGQATNLMIMIPDDLRDDQIYWTVKAIDTGLMASDWSYGQCSWRVDSLWTDKDYPNEDAYVDSYRPGTTLGAAPDSILLAVGDQSFGGGYKSRTYFQFYVGGAFLDTTAIQSVELYAYCIDTQPAVYYVGVMAQNDDFWKEETINWYNAPKSFYPYYNDVVEVDPGEWCMWDVTKLVEATVDFDLTLVLRGVDPAEGTPNARAEFWSKECPDPSYKPFLLYNYASIVGVEDGDTPLFSQLELDQNVPNPFNPQTRLGYTIPEGSAASVVRLKVYDVAGRLVTTLVDEPKPAGSYTIRWNGTNSRGEPAASGVYFYRLQWNGKVQSKKMLLLR